jgi:hypothetical protein
MENDTQAQDVNTVETDTTIASSSENQTASNTQTDESGGQEEKYVPYERFKEINDRLSQSEERYQQSLARLEALETNVKQPETVDPQQESLKQQLKALGFVTKEEQLAEIKRHKEDMEVQGEMARLEKTYDGSDGRPKFDRKAIVKFAIEKGIGDLDIAYKVSNESSLIDWHIKQASSKSKGVKTEASDGSGSAMAGTSITELKEAAKKGDRSCLITLIKRIALGNLLLV